jgi:hypothetical protein
VIRRESESHFLTDPKLIVEVLSEDERRDQFEKFLIYQYIPALEEHAVVSQNPKRPEVSIFRKSDGWTPAEVHISGEYEFRSIRFKALVEDLYAWQLPNRAGVPDLHAGLARWRYDRPVLQPSLASRYPNSASARSMSVLTLSQSL